MHFLFYVLMLNTRLLHDPWIVNNSFLSHWHRQMHFLIYLLKLDTRLLHGLQNMNDFF